MYNSVFVSIIVNIWRFIIFEYSKSLLKRIVDGFTRCASYLSDGSRIKSIFKSRESLISKSFIYSIYISFMNFINKVLQKIRNHIKNNGEYSLFYRNIYSLFKNKVEALRTLFIFTLSLGVGIAVNNIIRGHYSGKSYIVVAILVIGSIIGLSLKENHTKVLENSLGYKFIYSVFSIEEGLSSGD